MRSSAWLTMKVLACAAAVAGTVAGCSGIVGLVVDDSSPVPGGMVQAAISGQAPLQVVALASGQPMLIQGQSENLVVAVTCGDDAAGRDASAVLATGGAQITLAITSTSRSALQVHAGGVSCVAQTGTITLSTNAATELTGTFSGDGLDGTGAACSMTGTLTGVPQHR